jgi:hypothetical protein
VGWPFPLIEPLHDGLPPQIFPVFFPVPGELQTETGWLETGSTANQSCTKLGILRRSENGLTFRLDRVALERICGGNWSL